MSYITKCTLKLNNKKYETLGREKYEKVKAIL